MKLPIPLIATLLVGIAIATPDAHADVSAAARAFSDGQGAQLEGNYERAAQNFELAFNISPSREALRSAVRARQLANQLARAATLAQVLITQYPDDADSAKLANDVIAEARVKLARITITCSPHCTVAVGGRAISLHAAPSHVVFTAPGRQNLEITFDGDRSVTRDITVKAGTEVTLPIEAPLPPPPPKQEVVSISKPPVRTATPGLPPSVAIGAGAVTLALAGVAVWSALDTSSAHDAYVAKPTPEGWSSGRSKQLRTNVLLGATAATGITTALIAVFWTRWSGPHEGPHEVAIAPSAGGLSLSLGGRF